MSVPSSSHPLTAELLAKRRLDEIDGLVAKGDMQATQVAGVREALEERAPEKKWRLNLRLLTGILIAVALAIAVLRALTEPGGLQWLIAVPVHAEQAGDLNTVFFPFLATAVAIERLLETVFDWYEQSVKAVSKIVSETAKPIDWIETELREAYKAAEVAAHNTGIHADESSLRALEQAEQRLGEAERRLLSWVRAPEYMAWKRALSIWVGLMAGLVVAILGDLGMLRALALPAPRLIDMLMTGLVIGAGPGPMHSLIGMLQSGKDAISNLADLARASAVRKAVEDVRSLTPDADPGPDPA